jgi:hypothetical protein
MLLWMESHLLPYVRTTNLVKRLDEACLRRFPLAGFAGPEEAAAPI